MKFEGTLQAVELTKGAKSNTYDSIGNADVSFRRNTIDFMYFRNGNVEVNTGVSLVAESGKFDVIDSATPTNVVFKRGGVNFFTLDGAKNIIDVSTGRALSSQYIYADFITHRNSGADVVFKGSNTTDDGAVEYMRYRKADEDVNFSKDVSIIQGKKLYIHKETGKDSYIDSVNVASVNHTTFRNDINGELRFRTNGSTKFYVRANDISMSANLTSGANITCVALTETSDKNLKEDIKTINTKCSNIVKKIKVKKYTMKNDEKKRTNIGFIAQEVKSAIPKEFENIVNEDNEYMSLNYGRLTAVLWKSCQEMMDKLDKMEEEIKLLKSKVND